ncbi:MAG: prolipoprotein diacylglyceryl transferase family protein, partial [Polyangia bacterium]
RDGRAFAIFVGVYAAGRVFIEFLRGHRDRGHALGLSTGPWASVAIAAALVSSCIAARRRWRGPDSSRAPSPANAGAAEI